MTEKMPPEARYEPDYEVHHGAPFSEGTPPASALASRLPSDDHARLAFVRRLANGGASALPALLSALTDPNDFVRVVAARSLGRAAARSLTPEAHSSPSLSSADKAAASALLGALGDGNAFVRAEALTGLKALPRPLIRQAYSPPDPGVFVDCLNRVAVPPPPSPVRCGRCVALMVSPGFAGYLDDCLATLAAHGDCADARVVVLTVGDDPTCREVIARHGATEIPGRPLGRVDAASKGVLYSVARLVEADAYLCLDTDVLITGSLRPLFGALNVLASGSVLVARCAPWGPEDTEFHDLDAAVRRNYGGVPGDAAFLAGPGGEDGGDPGARFLKANSGVFAGRRAALLSLDAAIRSLQPFASAWVDAGGHGRDELVFSLALAVTGSAAEMGGAWNALLYGGGVECRDAGGELRFFVGGEPVRLLHFATPAGRSLLPAYRRLLGLPDRPCPPDNPTPVLTSPEGAAAMRPEGIS